MAYKFIWNKNNVLCVFSGNIDFNEITKANSIWHGDARFDNIKYLICNLLEANVTTTSVDDIAEMSATDFASSFSSSNIKTALVAQEKHTIAIFEHYIKRTKGFGSTWEFRIFNNIDDAVKWGES